MYTTYLQTASGLGESSIQRSEKKGKEGRGTDVQMNVIELLT